MPLIRFIVAAFAYLVDEWLTARIRWRCIHAGHALLCISDGHLCRKCGRFWSTYD